MADGELNSGDTAWLLTSTALVLMMSIPGLALFYAGLVRSKNALTQVNYVFLTVCEVTLLWFLYGFSLAFSTGNMSPGAFNRNSFFGDFQLGAMTSVAVHDSTGNIPMNVFATFQGTFAMITVALISGAYAERMKVSAMLVFNLIWLTIVYCPLAHMVWSGDGAMLYELGALDFAGGLVVHISSGFAGLLVAIAIGKRKGFPRIPKAPHSLVLSYIGGAMLWVGWFGFNAGSAVAADFYAGQALLVTQTSAAMGACAWSATEAYMFGQPSTLGLLSGSLAGLVAITPASGSVDFLGALVIGAVSGPLCLLASTSLKEAVDAYDDALDAFGIHGVGGIIGALLTGIWCSPSLGGAGYGTLVHSDGEPEPITNIGFQLGVQAASVVFAIVWVAIGTTIALKITDVLHGGFHLRVGYGLTAIRVSPKVEDEGIDESYFVENAYNFESKDLRISVEVGPLRGRRGHGLQLFYTSDSGTKHPIGPGQTTESRDDFAQQLHEAGGSVTVELPRDQEAPVVKDHSVSKRYTDAADADAGGPAS